MVLLAKTSPELIVALIAAGASLIVSVVTQFGTRRTGLRLAQIEEERAERSSRRDYEYEARKRLYEECEPLLFQAMELATTARSRILSLARTSRDGYLHPDGSGWLQGTGYYFKSTAYLLLAPLTAFRILQQRLTVVDLSLDPRLRTQYELLKLLFLSFNADFELARCQVPRPLPYEPDKTDPDEPEREVLLKTAPQRYARQGLYRGILDIVVEALIVEESDTKRCLTFGEFLRAWDDHGNQLNGARDEIQHLLGSFHPARKPVLWRVLIAQYLLYSELLRDAPLAATPKPVADAATAELDWRHESGDAGDEEVREPVIAAQAYVAEKLAEVVDRLPATEARTSRVASG